MNKRVLFIDVDGTIFCHKTRSIPHSTIKILEQIHNDVDLFLATGRSLSALQPIKEILPFLKGYILMNGTYVEVDKKPYRNIIMAKSDVISLINACRDFPIALLTSNQIYLSFHNEATKVILNGYFETTLINLNNQPFNLELAYNAAWLFVEKDIINKISKKIPSLKFVPWGNYGADVITAGESKAQGIKAIIDAYGYQHDNTYAIGDGENDIEMFEIVKNSICMGDGHHHALSKATYITDTITNDGFLKGIVHYRLNEKEKG